MKDPNLKITKLINLTLELERSNLKQGSKLKDLSYKGMTEGENSYLDTKESVYLLKRHNKRVQLL